jgi:hypothetical protein
MSTYQQHLQAFQDAMVHKKQAVILGLIKPARGNQFTPQARIDVYADGYDIRLVEATESDYPALSHYIGAEKLHSSVTEFVKATPSTFWDLNKYPVAFADYLEKHSDDKAAIALATLESAIAEIFWLPESKPLVAAQLAGLTEEAFGTLQLFPRTASTLLAFDYAVNDYLGAFRTGEPLETISTTPEYIYVLRHKDAMHRHPLTRAEYVLLEKLFSGLAVSDALERAISEQETLAEEIATSLQSWFAKWTSSGFFKIIT